MTHARRSGRRGDERIQNTVAGKPKNVAGVIVFGSWHRFIAAIVAVTTPRLRVSSMATARAMTGSTISWRMRDRSQRSGMASANRRASAGKCTLTCLTTVLTSVPFAVLGGAQDRYDRRAACHMIDMHGREAALVLVGLPEGKLLARVRRAECVVDTGDLLLAWRHAIAQLVDKDCNQPCRFRFARCVFQARDRRLWLRGRRRPQSAAARSTIEARGGLVCTDWPVEQAPDQSAMAVYQDICFSSDALPI